MELSNGQGFYREYHEWFEAFGDRITHPIPEEEQAKGRAYRLSRYRTSKHLFGFVSIAQAKRWFNKPDVVAELVDFKLVAYSDYVRKVAANAQCIFIPTSENKAEFPAPDLYNLTPSQLIAGAKKQLGL